MRKVLVYLFLGGLITVASCNKDSEDVTPIVHDETPYDLQFGKLPPPIIAADNPLTVQGVKLGKMLFYETKLSSDGTMSCGSCHQQENAFSDTNRFSTGVQGLQGGRQAMAIINMAWNTNEFFWDGRAHLLRDQSILPIQDELEMNETLENVVSKLSASQTYKDQFVRAFGSEEITSVKISLALEQFMNSLVSYQSKFDKYRAGEATLTASELRGMDLYFEEYNPFFPNLSGADCAHCHSPYNFENDRYMNNGLDEESAIVDTGREKVTMQASDRGKMKVTTLRNIEVTGPYMHDGRFNTLEEVVEHYNSGIKPSSTLEPVLANTIQTGLMLTDQDKIDLVAFLKTLTDESFLTNPEFSDPN
ncbi:MAG: cytochrome-c peroxidase [Salibacteraceae bacterium]